MARKPTITKTKVRKKRIPKTPLILPTTPIPSQTPLPSPVVEKKVEKVCWFKKIISWFK